MDASDIKKKLDRYYFYRAILYAPLSGIIPFIPPYIIAVFEKFRAGSVSEGLFVFAFGLFDIGVFVWPISYAVVLLIGAPIFLVLHKLRMDNLLVLIFISAFISYGLGKSLAVRESEVFIFTPSAVCIGIAAWILFNRRKKEHLLNIGHNNAW